MIMMHIEHSGLSKDVLSTLRGNVRAIAALHLFNAGVRPAQHEENIELRFHELGDEDVSKFSLEICIVTPWIAGSVRADTDKLSDLASRIAHDMQEFLKVSVSFRERLSVAIYPVFAMGYSVA